MELLQRFSFTLLLMTLTTLVACGGGGGGLSVDGGGGDDGSTDTVTLTLTKSDGTLSGENDITIYATVMQGSTPVSGRLVTFALSEETMGRATLTSTSQATGSDGVAPITVKATDLVGGVQITGTIAGVDPTSISFNSIGGGVIVEPDDGPIADSITLLASSQQLASSGAQSIRLTAIAKDGNNNLLEGVTIQFKSSSGDIGFVLDDEGNFITSDITGSDGKVSRNLATETNSANRIISVEVESGEVTDSLDIQVTGTIISLTGSSALAINDENSYTITVLDSDGTGLPNALVELSLSGQSTETPMSTVANISLPNEEVRTDPNGQVRVTITGTSGGTNTIIASALGATTEENVSVQADTFLFTNFGDGTNDVNPENASVNDILLSNTATATLTWLRSGVPVPDGSIVNFTTTRGTFSGNKTSSSAMTLNGKVSTSLTSTNAGKALLTFTGTDTVNGKSVELNNQLEFEFVADTADRLIAQVFPQSIGPNGQKSTVSVVVRDPQGNLVKNKFVDFSLDDTNSGAIEPAFAITDSNGSASTVYTSSNTSAHNGISIKATVRDTSITDTVELTVADREVFIALGTGNSIENDDETTYKKKYSVFVTDIDSNPIPNVTLTVSAIPSTYIKGVWVAVLKDGDFDHYATQPSAVCINEDIDSDGILSGSEDINGDGKLTPGNIVNAFGETTTEVTTDEEGRAVIDITYAEVFGHWATINLIASTKVNGTESFAKALFILPVSSDDVTNENNPPASFLGGASPFGSSSVCTDPN